MKRLIELAALSGAIAVAAGAFGAHAATGKAAEWLKTGGSYEMVHAVAAILGLSAAILFIGGHGLV